MSEPEPSEADLEAKPERLFSGRVLAVAVVMSLTIGIIAGAFLLAGNGGDSSKDAAATSTTAAPTSTSTTASDPDESGAEPPSPAECELLSTGTAAEQLAQTCEFSCSTALAFTAAATNPGAYNILDYSAAYIRLVDRDGKEYGPGDQIVLQDAVVEIVGRYQDLTDSPPQPMAQYTRWGVTGLPLEEADSVYPSYWFVDSGYDQGEIDFELDGRHFTPVHPLRESAQFLDTPLACFPNPHRSPSAESQLSPAHTTTTTTSPPSTTTTTTLNQLAAARSLFSNLVHTYCDNSVVPDPNAARYLPSGDTAFVVTDSNGDSVLLHLEESIVTSLDGPEGVLPNGYSFGCDPGVFVGTVWN